MSPLMKGFASKQLGKVNTSLEEKLEGRTD
jgi:hypothetical protein